MKTPLDFMGNPIATGDFVYRNEKLHKVLKIMPPDEYGDYRRVQLDLIYPYTWKKPQQHRACELLIITPQQMTVFMLTHTLPQKNATMG